MKNKSKKSFDCVKMKDQIQAKLLKRYQGLTAAKVRQLSKKRLAASQTPAAKIWRELFQKPKGNTDKETA